MSRPLRWSSPCRGATGAAVGTGRVVARADAARAGTARTHLGAAGSALGANCCGGATATRPVGAGRALTPGAARGRRLRDTGTGFNADCAHAGAAACAAASGCAGRTSATHPPAAPSPGGCNARANG